MQKIEYKLGVFPLTLVVKMDEFICKKAEEGYTLSRTTPCGADNRYILVVMERPLKQPNSPSMRKP